MKYAVYDVIQKSKKRGIGMKVLMKDKDGVVQTRHVSIKNIRAKLKETNEDNRKLYIPIVSK